MNMILQITFIWLGVGRPSRKHAIRIGIDLTLQSSHSSRNGMAIECFIFFVSGLCASLEDFLFSAGGLLEGEEMELDCFSEGEDNFAFFAAGLCSSLEDFVVFFTGDFLFITDCLSEGGEMESDCFLGGEDDAAGFFFFVCAED